MKNPSKNQIAIGNVFENTLKNITIDACPGSGKTTTIVWLTEKIPPYKKCIFLAFNKSIALELESRLPSHITSSTLHSYGMKTLMRHYRCKFKVKENKTFSIIIKNLFTKLKFKNEKLKIAYYFNLCKLYDLYRMNLSDLNPKAIEELADGYDVEYSKEYWNDFYDLVNILDTYNSRLTDDSLIDFTDMLYLIRDLPNTAYMQYDIVFVDEAQDLNKLQTQLVERLTKRNGRLIAVGDKRQGIYAFQGSSLDCFIGIMNRPNTVNLPLSISYRCSKAIIDEANKIFPTETPIEAFEGNDEGEVRFGNLNEIEEGDFVLCRNNRPLVELWLNLLKQGKAATIYGKDYGEKLLKLLDEINDLQEDQIEEYWVHKLETVVTELKERGVPNPTMTTKYANLIERIGILQTLKNHYRSYKKLSKVVENLFSDEMTGITLMTCHKSKGLENERVFLYKKELIPSPFALSEKMMRAEKCLAYVAITRAKKSLIYVDDRDIVRDDEEEKEEADSRDFMGKIR